MKNITVSLDDETHRRARIIAAETNASLKREERALREKITSYRASDRLARDAVHDRDA